MIHLTRLFSDKNVNLRNNFQNLVLSIESDIREFVEYEITTYMQNPNNKTLVDSVIANLALFDLSRLKTEQGVAQIKNLFNDHHTQIVNRRLKHFLSTCYIRYGIDPVDKIAEHTLHVISGVYDIDERIITDIDKEYMTFWLQPFIRKAWDDIFRQAPVINNTPIQETPQTQNTEK